MDRFAANALRTLGIATAVFVILGSGLLLLISLCFRSFSLSGHPEPPDPGNLAVSYAFMGGSVVALASGVFVIALLARGFVRTPDRSSGRLSSADGVAHTTSPRVAHL